MKFFGWSFFERIKENPPFYTIGTIFNTKAPVLIDTTFGQLYKTYLQVPHLRLIIEKKAEMFKNMDIKLRDKDGNLVDDHPVLKLLKHPNPLQSQEDWLAQLSITQDIFANSFIYKLSGFSNSLPGVMWMLHPAFVKIIPTGKIYEQSKLEGIIERYELTVLDKKFKTNEIIFTPDNLSVEELKGLSKLPSLAMPLSNIIGALKTRNIIIYDRGALGVLSADVKDGDGALPLTESNRQIITEQYSKDYGLEDEKKKLVISPVPVKWSPMSYPTRELMLFEEIEDDFATLCGAYGMARDLFPSIKGATFENFKQAERSTYESTIQPTADRWMRIFTREFEPFLNGLEFVADYSWIPTMQEDRQKEQAVKTAKIFGLSTMLKDGVINKAQYAKEINIQYNPTEDQQSLDDRVANAQTTLRGTVGGTTGLIEINRAVASGEMDVATATAIIVNIYGFDQATASTMVTEMSKPKTPTITT